MQSVCENSFFKMRIVKLTFIICLLFSGIITKAQDSTSTANTSDQSEPGFGERIFFGGNLGLQFGTYTFVDISPLVGYKITEKFQAGLGATYIYYSVHDDYFDYETNIYGGRVFSRYFLFEELFLHTELEVLNLEVPVTYYDFERRNITSVFVGGGYAQEIGSNSQLVFMLLYNLNEGQYSIYQNPIIRVGFNIGF